MIVLYMYLLIGALVGLLVFMSASSEPEKLQKMLADGGTHLSMNRISILTALISLLTVVIWPAMVVFVILVKE